MILVFLFHVLIFHPYSQICFFLDGLKFLQVNSDVVNFLSVLIHSFISFSFHLCLKEYLFHYLKTTLNLCYLLQLFLNKFICSLTEEVLVHHCRLKLIQETLTFHQRSEGLNQDCNWLEKTGLYFILIMELISLKSFLSLCSFWF